MAALLFNGKKENETDLINLDNPEKKFDISILSVKRKR